MLKWWSPVCLWLMQIFGMAGVAEQKSWLGWCLDMTLPSLSLACNLQLVEVAHPSQHSQGDRDRDLGSSGKVGEGADNHLLEWAEGWGSLSPLEKANTTLGSRRWQTSLQTRSHMGVRTKQNV